MINRLKRLLNARRRLYEDRARNYEAAAQEIKKHGNNGYYAYRATVLETTAQLYRERAGK